MLAWKITFKNVILLVIQHTAQRRRIMENCLPISEIQYKTLEEYKLEVDETIQSMIAKKERLVFAVVAEKAEVTRFVVRKFPELRNFILERMVYHKEINVINQKINRAVQNLQNSNSSLSFVSIVNKCRFNSQDIYRNPYIKSRIIEVLKK